MCLGDNSQEDPNPEALTKKTKETKGDQSQEDPNQEALTKKNKTKGDQRHEDPNPKALTNKNKKKQVSDRKGLANVVGMVGTILYETLFFVFLFFWSMPPALGPHGVGLLWSLWFVWSMPLGLGPPGFGLLWSLCFFGQCLWVWVLLALVCFGFVAFF